VVIYALDIRRRAMKAKGDLFEPFAFLDYCQELGAGGVQMALGQLEAAACERLRAKSAAYGMFIEGIVNPPFRDEELNRFEAEIHTAARVGAEVVRAVIMPGRRYEQFQSVEEFRQLSERGQRALERAVPIVERHRVRLAVENHKDHRVEERLALLEHLESTCVGACVDVGNNFALLEEPVAVVEALAPWAFSVHIKDQAVQEYDEGFLFADVPLGEGFLDLRKMVDILRRAKPEVRFNLETITRDPLKVPVLTDKYWATLGDVSGSELARTLRVVRTRRAQQLPQISQLPPAEQLASEAAGIVKSLQYAREKLGL
jgi:sugar phosphate isomerase/epimerase